MDPRIEHILNNRKLTDTVICISDYKRAQFVTNPISNLYLDLDKFLHVESLHINNMPSITHITLSPNTCYENLTLKINNCPNLIAIPEKIQRVNLLFDCDVNRIFGGTICYDNIVHLTLEHVPQTHISLGLLTPLKSLNILRIDDCVLEQLVLGSSFEKISITIANCVNFYKIAHCDPNTILSIDIENNKHVLILPDHTCSLRVSYTPYMIQRQTQTQAQAYLSDMIRIQTLPPKLKTLTITKTYGYPLELSLKNIPDQLKYVHFQYCIIDDVSYLPNSLYSLSCIDCTFNVQTLNNLPCGLGKIHFTRCNLNGFVNFPRLLEHLTVVDCGLRKITVGMGWGQGQGQGQGQYLKTLDCSKNHLTDADIENLPDSLERIECGGNRIHTIKKLPANLQVFRCTNYNRPPKTMRIYKLPPSLREFSIGDNVLLEYVPRRPSFHCTMDYNVDIWSKTVGIVDKIQYLGDLLRRPKRDAEQTVRTRYVDDR